MILLIDSCIFSSIDCALLQVARDMLCDLGKKSWSPALPATGAYLIKIPRICGVSRCRSLTTSRPKTGDRFVAVTAVWDVNMPPGHQTETVADRDGRRLPNGLNTTAKTAAPISPVRLQVDLVEMLCMETGICKTAQHSVAQGDIY